MKHTLKKSLAILLAMLMLLGVSATGAAAAPIKQPNLSAQANKIEAADVILVPEGTVTVTTPGTAKVELHYWDGEYYYDYGMADLSGLVLSATGGKLAAAQTIDYDIAQKGDLQNNIEWYVNIELDWEAQPDGWVLGANKAVLHVYGYQYSDFELVDGIYGEFKTEEFCFYGKAAFTIAGVKAPATSNLDFQSAEELTLGVPAAVSIPEPAKIQGSYYEYYEDAEEKLFKFTPAASGNYSFRSAGAKDGKVLYTEDGERHYFQGINPWATLYDADGYFLKYGDDNRGDAENGSNFVIFYALEAGKTYYLLTSAYAAGGDYTVRVEAPSSNKLVVPKTEICIKYGEYVSIADLVKGTTWEITELAIESWYGLEQHWVYLDDNRYYVEGISGYKPGTTSMAIYAPDGECVEITVKVKYTFAYLFRFLILGGWFTGMEGNGFWQTLGGFMWSILSIPVAILLIPLAPFFWLAGKLMNR